MSIENALIERCQNLCELCSASAPLSPFVVAPYTQMTVDHSVMICATCSDQLNNPEKTDVNHWRCLNDSMWSQVAPVQVLAWQKLNQLVGAEQTWAADLLEMMYMDEELTKWAETGLSQNQDKPKDVNGVELKKGDDVTVIKDLPIKGSSQVIKQGTVVRNINVSTEDSVHIQGKVNGQAMYVIAAYCRKK